MGSDIVLHIENCRNGAHYGVTVMGSEMPLGLVCTERPELKTRVTNIALLESIIYMTHCLLLWDNFKTPIWPLD